MVGEKIKITVARLWLKPFPRTSSCSIGHDALRESLGHRGIKHQQDRKCILHTVFIEAICRSKCSALNRTLNILGKLHGPCNKQTIKNQNELDLEFGSSSHCMSSLS